MENFMDKLNNIKDSLENITDELVPVTAFEPDYGYESGWAFRVDPNNDHILILDDEFEDIPCGSVIITDDDGNIIKSLELVFEDLLVTSKFPVPKNDKEAERIINEHCKEEE